jgi:hypothetical protein
MGVTSRTILALGVPNGTSVRVAPDEGCPVRLTRIVSVATWRRA